MKKVLFVCVENSCRSQMAEGFARERFGERCMVFSAGSNPAGKVDPSATQVMEEKGIDISHQIPKSLEELPVKEFDYVIGLGCKDSCPQVKARKRMDWEIPDPKGLPMEAFRISRDLIERALESLQKELFPLDPLKES